MPPTARQDLAPPRAIFIRLSMHRCSFFAAVLQSAAMRTQSAKAKGRRLQQSVAADLQQAFSLEPDDVRSTSMGANGEDVLLSSAAREKFPYSIECKNTERLNLWDSWGQAKANAGGHSPLLVVHKNNSETLCVLNWKVFLQLAQRSASLPGEQSRAAEQRADAERPEPVEAASDVLTPTATIRLGDEDGPHELAVALRAIAARLESARKEPNE